MRRNKSDYIAIAFGIILLIIVMSIAILASQSSRPNPAQEAENTTVDIPTPTVTPTPIVYTNEPPVAYEERAQDRLMDKIENRKPLSSNDALVKATIISTLPKDNPSGILYQSENVIIDYTNSANMFQVEIMTTDLAKAKAEANLWFRSRGMSQKGICDLPLMFYLNYDIRSEIQNTGETFNPLANGC